MFSHCCEEFREALISDIKQWLKDKGKEAIQNDSDKGDQKEVFGESKQLCWKWSPQLTKFVATTGEPLAEIKGRKVGSLDRAV